jgi:cysteinyl-tRNA synthetase
MSLKIYNTLTAKKEDFVPLEGKHVKMYTCGPTVYDLSHLGHARKEIVFDVIQRYLRYSGYEVTFVRNITDIDDKIINKAIELKKRPEQVAREFTYTFWKDMHALNVMPPDIEPRATEFIHAMIDFVAELIAEGHAYVSHGDVYFDVASFKEYGKLKKQSLDDLLSGARDQVRSQQELKEVKKSPVDFALWKSAGDNDLGWESPWGRGRPGWHLECSTMIKNVLGDTIDIHGGGEDLVFPHHENEIAQSESLHHTPLAKYWLHNSFVQVEAEKMSKSLGNFRTIEEVLKQFSPDTIRLFILQTHYRSPIEFTEEALKAAQSGLSRLIKAARQAGSKSEATMHASAELAKFRSDFEEAMNNDFNTSIALSVLYAMVDKINTSDPATASQIAFDLKKYAHVLGLTLKDNSKAINSKTAASVMDLVLELREKARENKDYASSDLIRDRLNNLGIKIMDVKGANADWEKA